MNIDNYQISKETPSFFRMRDYCLLSVKGPDAEAVLQGQSTNDVKKLKDGGVQLSAFLTPQGKIISHHFLFKLNKGEFYLLIPNSISEIVKTHLNDHIIMEDAHLEILNDLNIYHLLGVEDKYKNLGLSEKDKFELDHCYPLDHGFFITTGMLGQGSCLFITKEDYSFDFKEIDEHVFKTLRMESGFLEYPVDFDSKTLLPETGLQLNCVSFTKGCFTGQEIVARVKYRGSVNRHLMALLSEDDPSLLNKGDVLSGLDGKKMGIYRTCSWSPFLGKFIVFAYLAKQFRQPGSKLTFIDSNCSEIHAEVVSMPPRKDKNIKEQSRELYHQALELFAMSNEKDDILAEPLLKKALFLDPSFEDAYEALGVLLSRHERFDEAIELMKRLKELSPDTVMAYTNLSVFYMKKGMIEEAEAEKQEGTLATFRIAAAKRKQRLKNEDIEKAATAERERRRKMFEEVLGIDANDLAANFGLGKIALEEKRSKDAVQFLEKCLEIKRDYSVCCTLLARAYILEKRHQEANDLLIKGIAIAHEKGELMPKQEMEMLLQQLKEG